MDCDFCNYYDFYDLKSSSSGSYFHEPAILKVLREDTYHSYAILTILNIGKPNQRWQSADQSLLNTFSFRFLQEGVEKRIFILGKIAGQLRKNCRKFDKTDFMAKTLKSKSYLLDEVPSQINEGEILDFLYTRNVDWRYMNAIKELTYFSDDTISEWLNLSVRTLRTYRKPKTSFKENVREHVLLLLTVIKHGIKIFGTAQAFDNWLSRENFYFDNKPPESFLNTITGIKFVDDRLTAMEYGDNI